MSYQTNLRLLKVRAPAEGQTCGDLIKALHRGGGTPAAMPHDLLRKVTPVELKKVSTAPASAPAANTAARQYLTPEEIAALEARQEGEAREATIEAIRVAQRGPGRTLNARRA